MQKTTVAAVIAAMILISLVVALITGKIEHEAFTTSLAGIGAFFSIVIGYLAQDQKKKEE